MTQATKLLAFEVTAHPASVPMVRHNVVTFAAAHGADRDVLADVALAVTEAVSNAVRHGFVGVEPGRVRIIADVEEDLQVIVADDGSGIRPGSSPPGLGQGLSIIAEVTADFSVTPRDPQGTQVWMRFLLPD